MKDIVSKYKTSGIITYEILTNSEGLSESIGRRLLGIFKVYAIITSIT